MPSALQKSVDSAIDQIEKLPTVNPEALEFLANISQALWREPSFERLIKKFMRIQKDLFSVQRVRLMELQMRSGKAQWREAPIQLSGVKILENQFIDDMRDMFFSLHIRSHEYRQGFNTLSCNGRTIAFSLLGDPANLWYALLWEVDTALAVDTDREAYLDFLVRQVQSATSWFNRLDKTQALLYQDDLTGTFNVRYLDVALDSELRRMQRFGTTFSLLFIDLDNFKSINDRFGHLTGSNVLKQVSDVLKVASREVDSVIRYGGDEFVILLLGANSATALFAGERIRRILEETEFHVEGGHRLHVTASIGVASCPEHASDKAHLLAIADETMYKGKRSGKNKVIVLDDEALKLRP